MELDRAAPEISPNLEESYDMLRCLYYYYFFFFLKDVSSCDMWSFPNGKAHAEESGGGLSPRLSRYERGTKWTQPTLTITNSCTQCTTHLNPTRSSRFCTRIDLILCRHVSSHGSQGHSCARQMPSSGAVELADVKRDWWCTSFPAALLDILRFPELQREGKGLSAFFALTLDPKLDVFAILCQGFKFKDFEQFPSRRCCPHPWKRWFCNPRQIHKMTQRTSLWGTKNSDKNTDDTPDTNQCRQVIHGGSNSEISSMLTNSMAAPQPKAWMLRYAEICSDMVRWVLPFWYGWNGDPMSQWWKLWKASVCFRSVSGSWCGSEAPEGPVMRAIHHDASWCIVMRVMFRVLQSSSGTPWSPSCLQDMSCLTRSGDLTVLGADLGSKLTHPDTDGHWCREHRIYGNLWHRSFGAWPRSNFYKFFG